MTEPLITLPCTAQELENAIHAACDHDGLWDAKVKVLYNGKVCLVLCDATEEQKPRAKKVEPPDDTVVWVVYRDRNVLVTYKSRTWLGDVPFENGPRQVAIKLYEDHTAYGDTSPGYIKPVAWFYTEMEALNYIAKQTFGKPETKGEAK